MSRARWVVMILSCTAAIIVGIVAGPVLQIGTFHFLDGLLPHFDGRGWNDVPSPDTRGELTPNVPYLSGSVCGWSDVTSRGIQGAFVLQGPFLSGTIWGQFLAVPLVLSLFLSPRVGARVCVTAAVLLGLPFALHLLGLLEGTFSLLGAKHGMLAYFGFPLVCIAMLTLRAGFLVRSGVRGTNGWE